MVALLTPELHWECKLCGLTKVTHTALAPGSCIAELHACRGLGGVMTPMISAGIKAKVTAHVREDYVGLDLAQYDEDGRAIMSVTVERDDGTDLVVLAPTAVARIS